jgi:hypothetical protein
MEFLALREKLPKGVRTLVVEWWLMFRHRGGVVDPFIFLIPVHTISVYKESKRQVLCQIIQLHR